MRETKAKRLVLRRETLAELRPDELVEMQGGWDTTLVKSRCDACIFPTYRCTPVIL
jgi:hypothetical protein